MLIVAPSTALNRSRVWLSTRGTCLHQWHEPQALSVSDSGSVRLALTLPTLSHCRWSLTRVYYSLTYTSSSPDVHMTPHRSLEAERCTAAHPLCCVVSAHRAGGVRRRARAPVRHTTRRSCTAWALGGGRTPASASPAPATTGCHVIRRLPGSSHPVCVLACATLCEDALTWFVGTQSCAHQLNR